MKYLLDSDTFIDAKNRYYRFSFCPGYWTWIRRMHAADTIFSIKEIKSELLVGADELSDWVRTNKSSFFVPRPKELSNSLGLIPDWVESMNYTQAAKNEFYSKADYVLIAHAHCMNYTLVTKEVSRPEQLSRVKIPDVCHGINVPVIDPFELMEKLSAKLVASDELENS